MSNISDKIQALANKALNSPKIIKFNGTDVDSDTGISQQAFMSITEGDELPTPRPDEEITGPIDSTRAKREFEEKQKAYTAEIFLGKDIEGAAPKKDEEKKAANALEDDYLGELIALVQKNGQTMLHRKNQYEILTDKNLDLVLDSKGTIKYQRMDVDGQQIQGYVGLNAKHKFSKNNKQINLKLNTDIIKDENVAKAFFLNTINTLKDNNIEIYRINIVNPEYKYLLDEFLKKESTINNSQKFEVSEGGEVVAKDTSKELTEQEKEKANDEKKLEGAFKLGTAAITKDSTKEEIQNGLDRVGIKLEHLENGTYTKITKLESEPNGEFNTTVVKTSELGAGKPNQPSRGEHVYNIMSQETKLTNTATNTATNEIKSQGIEVATDAPKAEANNTNTTPNQPAVAPERDLDKAVNKVINHCGGLACTVEKLAEREKIEVSFDEDLKVMTAHFKDAPEKTIKIDITESKMGKALHENLKAQAEMTFADTAKALTESGSLKKTINTLSTKPEF